MKKGHHKQLYTKTNQVQYSPIAAQFIVIQLIKFIPVLSRVEIKISYNNSEWKTVCYNFALPTSKEQ